MSNTDTQGELWEVFIQSKAGQPFKHAGAIHAFDREMAIENARDTYTRRGEGTGLWVVKSKDIVSVLPNEAGYFFDPANDKVYRHPTFYDMPEGVKNM